MSTPCNFTLDKKSNKLISQNVLSIVWDFKLHIFRKILDNLPLHDVQLLSIADTFEKTHLWAAKQTHWEAELQSTFELAICLFTTLYHLFLEGEGSHLMIRKISIITYFKSPVTTSLHTLWEPDSIFIVAQVYRCVHSQACVLY